MRIFSSLQTTVKAVGKSRYWVYLHTDSDLVEGRDYIAMGVAGTGRGKFFFLPAGIERLRSIAKQEHAAKERNN